MYQILILRDPSLRKVLRAGRRLGKTFSLAIQLLHYSYTHKDGRSLVIAPMKTQVELIYQEILRISAKNEVVTNSITRMEQESKQEIMRLQSTITGLTLVKNDINVDNDKIKPLPIGLDIKITPIHNTPFQVPLMGSVNVKLSH